MAYGEITVRADTRQITFLKDRASDAERLIVEAIELLREIKDTLGEIEDMRLYKTVVDHWEKVRDELLEIYRRASGAKLHTDGIERELEDALETATILKALLTAVERKGGEMNFKDVAGLSVHSQRLYKDLKGILNQSIPTLEKSVKAAIEAVKSAESEIVKDLMEVIKLPSEGEIEDYLFKIGAKVSTATENTSELVFAAEEIEKKLGECACRIDVSDKLRYG